MSFSSNFEVKATLYFWVHDAELYGGPGTVGFAKQSLKLIPGAKLEDFNDIMAIDCKSSMAAMLGETFRFSLVRESGNVGGMIQTGKVQRIHRAARRMAVDLYMPDLKCTHSYFAKEIYYRGRPRKDFVCE